MQRPTTIEALEVELAQANLSLYLQLTPMEEIQWPQVAEVWDRLEQGRSPAVHQEVR